MRRILLILTLVTLAASAQDSVRMISRFADPYGNVGSFWSVVYQGKPYSLLKLKSPDREEDADFAFDAAGLAEFEVQVAKLHKAPNTLKQDGFQVLWSKSFGDSTVRTLLGRLNGVKVRMIQIDQTPEGKSKREHQITIDQAYAEFSSALRKFKRSPQ